METRITKGHKATRLGVILATLFAPLAAMAGTIPAGDPFAQFLQAVQGYAQGALGISIAVVALIFGAIVGIGRNAPTSALSGVAFAIFIYFGPGIIFSIFNAGAVLV